MNVQTKKQGGFTLIELMIVVTILGILASMAVPIYRDYTIRSRVGETASVFGPIKTEVSIFYSEQGRLPTSLNDLANSGRISSLAADYAGDYVDRLTIAADGTVTVLLNNNNLGVASNRSVIFQPVIPDDTNIIEWNVVGGPGNAADGEALDAKYLPITGEALVD